MAHFPVQQQAQGNWTPSITAVPFYPQLYHPQQQQYYMFAPQQYPPAFHPYRRPNRHQQQHPHQLQQQDHHPPYARPDPSASQSSLHSNNSRPRTNSNQSTHSSHSTRPHNNHRSAPRPPPPPATTTSPTTTTTSSSSSTTTTTATTISPITTHRLRPSPLSQAHSEKRISRDDADLAVMLDSANRSSSGIGLKGRLRRALSFNALKEEEVTPPPDPNNDDDDDDDDEGADNQSIKASARYPNRKDSSARPDSACTIRSPDDPEPPTPADNLQQPKPKKKGRAASLFNSRLNASTDNISLSSTVSSASVMIRKLGSMSKLVVRRNSLAGITSIFKDKNKDPDKAAKKKDKNSAKSPALQAKVSHVHAELDKPSESISSPSSNALSPAAELARQHTLRTRAENAAKAKAQQEAQAAATAAAAAAASAAAAAAASSSSPSITTNGNAGVPSWDKNTATRAGSSSRGVKVAEDGTRIVVEDEDEDSDEGHYDYNIEGWDDDDDWDVPDDEDATIRVSMSKATIQEGYQDQVEPWAQDIRRSVERSKRPTRGILKNAGSYDQSKYLADQATPARVRSNSYNSHPGQTELGPLARIPSPDPDHIDGLHRHNSHSSVHATPTNSTLAPSIPPLRFETSSPIPSDFSPSDTHSHHSPLPHPPPPPPPLSERPSSIFQHPALNSSAPALSMVPSSAPTLTHRSATAPTKKLAFATSLSVYDTFPPSVYDRRSEPATWSRLTPALAQRIKEELNSYKMEEMEVHASSRIHTQFFV